jgi:hypothetical protein
LLTLLLIGYVRVMVGGILLGRGRLGERQHGGERGRGDECLTSHDALLCDQAMEAKSV